MKQKCKGALPFLKCAVQSFKIHQHAKIFYPMKDGGDKRSGLNAQAIDAGFLAG